MEDIVAIVMSLGMAPAIVFIVKYFRLREKQLEAQKQQGLLGAGNSDERKRLEARIEHLETIVTSVDFELNQRLNHVLAQGALSGQVVAKPAGVEPKLPAPVMFPGQLEPGTLVDGRYTIVSLLGHGGMGAVYRATDGKLGQTIALKTILSTLVTDPQELRRRFHHEVAATRRITHPNVIRLYDLGESGPLLYLSMEFVEGRTLADEVKAQAPSVATVLTYLRGALAGVAGAHREGIVHRDLKPQNILIDRAGEVKVIDFGLASSNFQSSRTATGIIMGTPEYMAPEQIRGSRCDARTDVYALGATAFFALTGRPPFQANSPIAVGFAQVNDPAPDIRTLRPEVPAAVAAVIQRALAKDPAARPADAAEFLSALA